MSKRKLWISLAALALLSVLGIGAVAGGAIGYLIFQARPALAQEGTPSDQEQGLLVVRVGKNSPAAQAGLVRGDIILTVNGRDVNDTAAVQDVLANLKPGDQVTVSIQHGDEQRDLTVTLGDRDGKPFIGISTDTCQTSVERFSVFAGGLGNAWITAIEAGSPAEQAGLEAGNIVTAVNGQELNAEQTLGDLIAKHKPGDEITLTVEKPGQAAQEVKITLGQNPDDTQKAYLGIQYHTGAPFMERFKNGELPFEHPLEIPEGLGQGMIVGLVEEDSPAAQAGLTAGSIITGLNGEEINSPRDLQQAIAALKPGDTITLDVYSKETEGTSQIEVTLGESPDQPGKAYLGISAMGFFKQEMNVQPGTMPGDQPDVPALPGQDSMFELPAIKQVLPQPSI